MKRGNTRPFRAPRASKPVETVHRKDNAEWGKGMERQLAQIEKRQTSIETAHIQDKSVATAIVDIQQASDEAKQDSDDEEPIVHQIPS